MRKTKAAGLFALLFILLFVLGACAPKDFDSRLSESRAFARMDAYDLRRTDFAATLTVSRRVSSIQSATAAATLRVQNTERFYRAHLAFSIDEAFTAFSLPYLPLSATASERSDAAAWTGEVWLDAGGLYTDFDGDREYIALPLGLLDFSSQAPSVATLLHLLLLAGGLGVDPVADADGNLALDGLYDLLCVLDAAEHGGLSLIDPLLAESARPAFKAMYAAYPFRANGSLHASRLIGEFSAGSKLSFKNRRNTFTFKLDAAKLTAPAVAFLRAASHSISKDQFDTATDLLDLVLRISEFSLTLGRDFFEEIALVLDLSQLPVGIGKIDLSCRFDVAPQSVEIPAAGGSWTSTGGAYL